MRSRNRWLVAVIAAGALSRIATATASADEIPPQTTPTPSDAPTASSADAAVKSGIPLTSNTIANIAERLAPAVVNIENDKEIVAQMSTGNPMLDMMNQLNGGGLFMFNGQRITPGQVPGQRGGQEHKAERRQIGTGFVIRPDGYILTNAHVVKGATKIKVTMNDKKVLPGTIIGIDGYSDLAVIKIDGKNLPVATLGDSDTIRPGEFAIAIGSPQALDHTVTLGIISAVGRTIHDVNGNINFIQTDAAINYGNSGGPLLNLTGEVIGINTAIKPNAQNIGFSIPVNVAKTVSSELIDHKFVSRPWFGISMMPIDETLAKSLGLSSDTKGVVVAQVIANSPAQKAGLVLRDIIQKIDGKSVDTPKAIQDIVHSHKVGDTINLSVVHKDTLKAVAVQIGQYPDHIPGAGAEEDE